MNLYAVHWVNRGGGDYIPPDAGGGGDYNSDISGTEIITARTAKTALNAVKEIKPNAIVRRPIKIAEA